MDPVIRVARTAPDRLMLSDRSGAPVWPDFSPEAHARVSEAARLFGASLVQVNADPCESERRDVAPSDAGAAGAARVVGVGAPTWRAARLYAHLTGRTFVGVQSAEECVSVNMDVVVLLYSNLTPDLLDGLHARDAAARCVGIVVAESADELVLQVLTRAVGGVLPAPNSGELCLDPDLPGSDVWTSAGVSLRHDAPPHLLNKVLRFGFSALHIDAHCDGLCASLGERILCPMDRPPSDPDDTAPPCARSGSCHRLDVPLADAVACERTISPDAFAAPLMVMSTCWGVVPSPFLWDVRWSLGYRFLQSRRVGALVATWEVVFVRPEMKSEFRRAIVSGSPIGEALVGFLAAEGANRTGFRAALFGDPRLRLRPGPAAPASPRRRSSSASYPAAAGLLPRIDFMCGVLATAQSVRPELAQTQAGLDLDAALVELEPRAWSGRVSRELANRFRTAALSFAAAWNGAFVHLWASAVKRFELHRDGRRCFACAQQAREYRAEFSSPELPPRRLLMCAKCGIVEDAELKAPEIVPRVSGGTVAFLGAPERGDWSLVIKLTNLGNEEPIVVAHAVDDGSTTFPLPGTCPPHLHFFQFALFTGDGITCLWYPVPHEPA